CRFSAKTASSSMNRTFLASDTTLFRLFWLYTGVAWLQGAIGNAIATHSQHVSCQLIPWMTRNEADGPARVKLRLIEGGRGGIGNLGILGGSAAGNADGSDQLAAGHDHLSTFDRREIAQFEHDGAAAAAGQEFLRSLGVDAESACRIGLVLGNRGDTGAG